MFKIDNKTEPLIRTNISFSERQYNYYEDLRLKSKLLNSDLRSKLPTQQSMLDFEHDHEFTSKLKEERLEIKNKYSNEKNGSLFKLIKSKDSDNNSKKIFKHEYRKFNSKDSVKIGIFKNEPELIYDYKLDIKIY